MLAASSGVSHLQVHCCLWWFGCGQKKAAVVPVAAALVVNMEQSDVHIVCGMRTLEATDV